MTLERTHKHIIFIAVHPGTLRITCRTRGHRISRGHRRRLPKPNCLARGICGICDTLWLPALVSVCMCFCVFVFFLLDFLVLRRQDRCAPEMCMCTVHCTRRTQICARSLRRFVDAHTCISQGFGTMPGPCVCSLRQTYLSCACARAGIIHIFHTKV